MSWFSSKQKNQIETRNNIAALETMQMQQSNAKMEAYKMAMQQAQMYNQIQNAQLYGTTTGGTGGPYSGSISTSSTIFPSTNTYTTTTLNPVRDRTVSKYAMTEEGLENLVNGKLCVSKLGKEDTRGDFLITYDSLQIGLNPFVFKFMYKGTVIFTLSGEEYIIGKYDTLTLSELEGKVPFTIMR